METCPIPRKKANKALQPNDYGSFSHFKKRYKYISVTVFILTEMPVNIEL